MEIKVGETITYKHFILKAEKSTECCIGCFFYLSDFDMCAFDKRDIIIGAL